MSLVASLMDGSADTSSYVLVALAAAVLLGSMWNLVTALKVAHLPGPFMLPIFGNVLSVTSEPWGQFARWHEQFGKIYRFGIWNLNMVAVCDPDAIKAILSTEKHKFTKDEWTYDTFRPILGRGLVTAMGQRWKHGRQMLKPAFHFDSLRRLLPVFTQAAQRLCVQWSKQPASSPVELGLTFRTVTLEVISEVAVGLDSSKASVLPVLFEAVLDELNQRVMKPWRAYMPLEAEHQRKLTALNNLVFEIIAARRAARAKNGGRSLAAAEASGGNATAAALGGDMLDLMLDHEAAHPEEGPLSDDVVADELKTMLLAGHETSSMMMLWSCYLLAKHPEKLAKARAEVDEALGGYSDPTGDWADYNAYKGLEYLECVMKEAMRLYTPVPVLTRDTLETTKLCGQTVPKGSCVVMSCWALHRDAAVWGKDCDEFRPERFGKEESKGRHPFAYIPFSEGTRNCIGRNLALVEAKVVLGTILQRWELQLTEGPDGSGAKLRADGRVETDCYIIPVRPDGGLWVKVSPRK